MYENQPDVAALKARIAAQDVALSDLRKEIVQLGKDAARTDRLHRAALDAAEVSIADYDAELVAGHAEVLRLSAELEDAKQAEWKLIASTDSQTMQSNLLDDATFRKYPAGLKLAVEKLGLQVEAERRMCAALQTSNAELWKDNALVMGEIVRLRAETVWSHIKRAWHNWYWSET
jgi:hypothetical protein